MTYLAFHLIFTVPPILVVTLVLLRWKGGGWLLQRVKAIGFLAVIAVAYTTPWDNYLVYKEVWSYGRDRVLGTIGYVPIEEYAFFVLQSLLTGLLLLAMDEWRSSDASPIDKPSGKTAVAASFVLLFGLGAIGLVSDATLYLGLIIVWSVPVMLFLWVLGAKPIVQRMRIWVPVVLLSTFYLGAADRVAIAAQTWSISKDLTTGLHVFGLPIEEALFFLVTNVMVAWGIILFEHFQDRELVLAPDNSPSKSEA